MKYKNYIAKAIRKIFLYASLIYLGLCAYIYIIQNSLIFFPTKTDYSQHLNKNAEEVVYNVNGVKLHGWLVNKKYAGKKLIFYYGGNAEDVYHNIADFSNLKAAVLLINYRGYGYSEGEPSEKAFFSDALAIVQKGKTTLEPEKIILFGRSIGTGTATFVTSQVENDGLLLITPFDSMANVAGEYYPFLPISLLLKHKFNSIQFAPKIKSPTLIIYGSKDRVIPNERTENLFNFFKTKLKIVRIDNADHNDITAYSKYWNEVSKFVENL